VFHNLFERYGEIQSRRNDEKTSEKGFTLIELLIVIVVLGILAAIVIFSLSGVTGTSAVAACKSDAKTVETAVSAYQAQNPSATMPDISGTGVATSAGAPATNPLVPNYLHTWPSADSNAPYSISYNASGSAPTGVLVTSGGNTVSADNSSECTGA
jgi:prepilin-type N-terminal cleavage/methylation domain-containing protein